MGRVRLTYLVTAQDVGRVINPQGLEGQSKGGALYGAGMSLWEDTLLLDGVMKTPNFTTYLIGTPATPERVFRALREKAEKARAP